MNLLYIIITTFFVYGRTTNAFDSKYTLLRPPDKTATVYDSYTPGLSSYKFTSGKPAEVNLTETDLVGLNLTAPFIVAAIFKSYNGQSSCLFSIMQGENTVMSLCLRPFKSKATRVTLHTELYSPEDSITYLFNGTFKDKWTKIAVYVKDGKANWYVNCRKSPHTLTLHKNRNVLLTKYMKIKLAFSKSKKSKFEGLIEEISWHTDADQKHTNKRHNRHTHKNATLDVLKYVCPELTGYPGPKGQKGSVGPLGPRGKSGEQGNRGYPGAIGDQGSVGPSGPAGIRGSKGDEGHGGPMGYPGIKGDKGDQGDKGLPGRDGVMGPKGEKGSTPEIDLSKGDKGDRGVTGEPGMPGPVGPQGAPGVCGPPGPGQTRPLGGSIFLPDTETTSHVFKPTTAPDVKHTLLTRIPTVDAEIVNDSYTPGLSSYKFTSGKPVEVDPSKTGLVGLNLSAPFIVTAIFKSYTDNASCLFSITQDERTVMSLCLQPAGLNVTRITLHTELYSPEDSISYLFNETYKDKWTKIVMYVKNDTAHLYVNCSKSPNTLTLLKNRDVLLSTNMKINLAFSESRLFKFEGIIEEINLRTNVNDETLLLVCEEARSIFTSEGQVKKNLEERRSQPPPYDFIKDLTECRREITYIKEGMNDQIENIKLSIRNEIRQDIEELKNKYTTEHNVTQNKIFELEKEIYKLKNENRVP